MCRLLEADAGLGAMLLEKAVPGDSLLELFKNGRDEEATEIFAGMAISIRAAKPRAADQGTSGWGFATTADWGRGWRRLRELAGGGTGPVGKALFERSEAVYAELLASSSRQTLLHGDLHHQNILSTGGGGWIAIDPKGVLGEPEYEAGAWIRNPLPLLAESPDMRGMLARRIAIISERLGYDPRRVGRWAFAQAVLAAIWMVEDHGAGYSPFIAVAEALDSLP